MVRVEQREVVPDREPVPGGPVVAVVVSLNFPQLTAPVAELVRRFTRTAVDTLLDVGADPRLVDLTGASLPPVAEVVAADGVLLLGGGDVDAMLYGVAGPVPNEYGVDRAADEYSIAVVRAALAADVPVLAVCRGAQVLNVACGGTLIPDIVDATLHHGASDETLFVDERVRLAPDSRLAGIVRTDELVVRTGHHQAVDQVGSGLRAVGWADDGIVEAVEHDERWAVGVQWHPEDSHGSEEDRHRVFGAFVAEAASRGDGRVVP